MNPESLPSTGNTIEPNPHVDLNNARNLKALEEETLIELGRCDELQRLQSAMKNRTEQLPGQPQFNSLHISRLDQKVDGETEHLFVAILNGGAVGSVVARMVRWIQPTPDTAPLSESEITGSANAKAIEACQLKMLYVMPVHRHRGLATRLIQNVESWAKKEGATQLELCCMKGNTAGRKFWIQRGRFIDDLERHADGPRASEYVCMVKEI